MTSHFITKDELASQVMVVFKQFLEETPNDDPDDSINDVEINLDAGDANGTSKDDSIKLKKKSKYGVEAIKLLTQERNTLFVDFKDIEVFDVNLAEDIILEYYRFYPFLCQGLAQFVREEKIRVAERELDPSISAAERALACELIRRELEVPQIKNKSYYVGFYNFAERDKIRDLSCTKIGTLTRVSGQVVRAHTVHPELILGKFRCKDCLKEQYAEQEFRYTIPTICVNENCSNKSKFDLLLNQSKFTDFQRLRIQETQQELPRGSIPRSFDVIIRGADQVECIQPGDQCDFVGTLIAVPDVGQMMGGTFGTVSSELNAESGVTGLQSLGVKEMTHTLAFLANACIIEGQMKPLLNTDESHREVFGTGCDFSDFTKEEIIKIESMSKDVRLLDNLSTSLFSSIYGYDDIKRGIFLQLLGGVPKHTKTGTHLRGDINICMVGDPSTSKSQFLKIVTDFAPVKAVYASGKASSASGLTAAVIRDTDGGFVIEAGALMLADRGICCIDEFDKMDLKDQVALHEAMEQQTISITKAGVTATLNARASILAAANPIGGTYDLTKSLKANVNFSLPIMSRFDLFYTISDAQDETIDKAVSHKILNFHKMYANSSNLCQDMRYSFDDISLYLKFARRYYPRIPIETEGTIVQEYVRLRQNCARDKKNYKITVRQLDSIIRLSEAIARAHCEELVKPSYVRLAAKLIENTLVTVGDVEVNLEADKNDTDSDNTVDQQNDRVSSPRPHPRFPQRPNYVITVGKYKEMTEILLTKLKNEQENDARNHPGMPREELVEWYLERCVSTNDVNTEEELIYQRNITERVVERLCRGDHLLLELRASDNSVLDPNCYKPRDYPTMIMINPQLDLDEFFETLLN